MVRKHDQLKTGQNPKMILLKSRRHTNGQEEYESFLTIIRN
jgi:uncharacterized protein YbcV (DUF1398 family)